MHTILDCKTFKGLAKITDNGTRGARFCSSESLKRKRVTFLILVVMMAMAAMEYPYT